MNATLYPPISRYGCCQSKGYVCLDSITEFAWVPKQVPGLLGCVPELVDVLACGPEYVVNSIFELTKLQWPQAVSGIASDPDNDNDVLCNAVFAVYKSKTSEL